MADTVTKQANGKFRVSGAVATRKAQARAALAALPEFGGRTPDQAAAAAQAAMGATLASMRDYVQQQARAIAALMALLEE